MRLATSRLVAGSGPDATVSYCAHGPPRRRQAITVLLHDTQADARVSLALIDGGGHCSNRHDFAFLAIDHVIRAPMSRSTDCQTLRLKKIDSVGARLGWPFGRGA